MTTRTINGGTYTIASLLDQPHGLTGLRAEGVTLIGPAILAAGDFRFEGSHKLDGRPDDFIWDVDPNRQRVVGAVIVEDCVFVDCTFVMVGVAISPEYQSALLETLSV